MILFNDIVEILALAQKNSAGENTLGFQGFHCGRIGRVLIHVDDPRNGIEGELNTFSKNRLAAAVSPFAVSRKSMACPVESTARYRYLSCPLTFI
jgi:hypothetical protein